VLLRGGRRAAELEEGVGVWAEGEGVEDSMMSSEDCISKKCGDQDQGWCVVGKGARDRRGSGQAKHLSLSMFVKCRIE
jgi:hypothetical protein